MLGTLLAIRTAFGLVVVLLGCGLVIWFVLRVFADSVEWFREEVLFQRRQRKPARKDTRRDAHDEEGHENPEAAGRGQTDSQ